MKNLLLLAGTLMLLQACNFRADTPTEVTYQDIKNETIRGWNTWDTRSVMRQVLLPQGYALTVHVKDLSSGKTITIGFIGNKVPDTEQIRPGLHAWDGSYTEQQFIWNDIEFTLETAHADDDLVMLFTPAEGSRKDFRIEVIPMVLWERDGSVEWNTHSARFVNQGEEISLYPVTGEITFRGEEGYIEIPNHVQAALSTGSERESDKVQNIIFAARKATLAQFEGMGESGEAWKAVQTVLAWNTIYDPVNDRIVTPVSRIWNYGWDGYVLFCWDNYFASYMCAYNSRKMAFTNAIEITNEITDGGFVPNFAATHNLKSYDRSQPPVGSMMIHEIYKKYPEKWFLEEVYDKLLTWNRWWPDNRDLDGFLCWGSSPFEPVTGDHREKEQNILKAAILESGLDNSPLYDSVGFDSVNHVMLLADVGLMGLYIMDCEALADIAALLEKPEVDELRERAAFYRKNLATLWNEEQGIFLNKYMDTGEFSYRLSPTNFYPLLGKAATQEQAERMVNEHLLNEEEFWGEWVLPSISRNDPAYPDNSYWRGRIWAPMNFLVYLGLRNYDLPEATRQLADKSMELLMKDWQARGYIHENYNADTGEGVDVANSDNFYHWGGLLGFIYMIENGVMPPTETTITK